MQLNPTALATDVAEVAIKETFKFMTTNQKAALFIGSGMVLLVVGIMFLTTKPELVA